MIVDERGSVVASGTEEHRAFDSPQPGWAEQSPEDWWRACGIAVKRALESGGISGDEIACVGFSGQMHGAVLLDERDEVVRPALIWCDQRTEQEARWLEEKIGRARLIELTLNPALTNFTLTKLLWVREHEPKNWQRIRHLMLPKDYVRFRLTGERATDVADASGTLLFDVARREWSAEVARLAGIDVAMLPRAYESPEICAQISGDGAAATGLRAGTPVVAGAGDQAAGAVGMGIVRAGRVSATIGTSGVVFAATEKPSMDPQGRLHTFCHAIPGRWFVMGVTQAAGLSLRWFRDTFGAAGADDGRDAYERLTEEADDAPACVEGIFWGPYLMGERTPYCDPNVRAALIGLAASHGRAQIIRAILEGVAFSLRDTLSIFGEIGVPVQEIRLGGGGARSKLWRKVQAEVYGREVARVENEEGAAYGAAILAGVGVGAWKSVDDACAAVVRVAERIQPDAKRLEEMESGYRTYGKIYPALKQIFDNKGAH